MRSPRLSVKTLKNLFACEEAMEELEELFPGQKSVSIKKILPELTKEHPNWLIWCLGKAALIKPFAEAGADVDFRDACGCTPLRFAVDLNRPKVIEALLKAGANPNAKGCLFFKERSILKMAMDHGDKETTQLLLKYGAKKTDEELKEEKQEQSNKE